MALESETRGMAIEVSSLAPGVIDTEMQEAVRGASAEDFVDVEPWRRWRVAERHRHRVVAPRADRREDIPQRAPDGDAAGLNGLADGLRAHVEDARERFRASDEQANARVRGLCLPGGIGF